MAPSRPDEESPAPSPGPGQAVSGHHALREQDVLWADFLALAASVVNSLEKSVQAICDGRFDLISEVENEEEDSNRREVLIEQQCLRILALYEPVAWDLRRMATVLKVNHDWERIADLALRVARRARKLAQPRRHGHARSAQANGSRCALTGACKLPRGIPGRVDLGGCPPRCRVRR